GVRQRKRKQRVSGQRRVIQRKNTTRASHVERTERDTAGPLPFAEQQRGDQKPADAEKELHAQVAASDEARVRARGRVVPDDRQNREAAQAVERREIANTGEARIAVVRRGAGSRTE